MPEPDPPDPAAPGPDRPPRRPEPVDRLLDVIARLIARRVARSRGDVAAPPATPAPGRPGAPRLDPGAPPPPDGAGRY